MTTPRSYTTRTTLREKLSKARSHVNMRDVFFGSILMDMEPIISADRTDDCATDGDVIAFNPDWLAANDVPTVAQYMRKMALHVAFKHHLRRGGRDLGQWQQACTQAVGWIMRNDGVVRSFTKKSSGATRFLLVLFVLMFVVLLLYVNYLRKRLVDKESKAPLLS